MKTFSQRLTLRFAALVTVTTAIVLGVGGWLLDGQMLHSLEVLHEGEFRELRGLIGDAVLTPAEVARRISHDAESDAALYFIQVHSDQGQVLFRSANLGNNVLPDLTGHDLHASFDLRGFGPVHVSEFHAGPLHVQVASPLAPTQRVMRDYLEVAAFLCLAVAGLSVALGYAFSRLTLQPLRAIAETADRIRSDNLSERIPMTTGDDELTSLTRLLNQMFDRLQTSFEQVRRFAADVSHEVKTPLALIRLNAEKLQARLASDPEATAAVADILEEIAQINQVTDRLLFLAKSESGALKLAWRVVSPPALLGPLAEDAQVLAADRGVRFALELNDPGEIRVDPELLRQLLLNLVANAVSVSPAGGLVTLESRRTPGGWRLVVRDEGPGLPPAHLDRLFERFVRFDSEARREARPGHGLGLAISKAITDLHGGSIRAENRGDRSGLQVVVDLPAGTG
ncbi:MAG: HAMP domain-containing protein [Verrucomicrobia bacterium]|jgi:signal transduction histidine kinase|nr:HAMP domain-containing protein [Verrucomicrobiota bacterium]